MPAPLGNQNAAKAKRWEAAICRALSSWPNEPSSDDCSELIQGLNKAAHKFVKNMMDAEEISFFRELGDRIDGKPTQAVEHAGNGGGSIGITTSGTIDHRVLPATSEFLSALLRAGADTSLAQPDADGPVLPAAVRPEASGS